MTIKTTDQEVTLNFTGANIEGYVARGALFLLLQNPDSFSPEDAQRLNTLLTQIEEGLKINE